MGYLMTVRAKQVSPWRLLLKYTVKLSRIIHSTQIAKSFGDYGGGFFSFKYTKGQASTLFKDIYHILYHGKVSMSE
jgi:hypothetical protein